MLRQAWSGQKVWRHVSARNRSCRLHRRRGRRAVRNVYLLMNSKLTSHTIRHSHNRPKGWSVGDWT
eukprot:1366163-Rhodomonas_salina.1